MRAISLESIQYLAFGFAMVIPALAMTSHGLRWLMRRKRFYCSWLPFLALPLAGCFFTSPQLGVVLSDESVVILAMPLMNILYLAFWFFLFLTLFDREIVDLSTARYGKKWVGGAVFGYYSGYEIDSIIWLVYSISSIVLSMWLYKHFEVPVKLQ